MRYHYLITTTHNNKVKIHAQFSISINGLPENPKSQDPMTRQKHREGKETPFFLGIWSLDLGIWNSKRVDSGSVSTLDFQAILS